jgi:glycosyltransferase involved in cell wall biosynthesis
MNEKNPTVSVIIPTYNRAHLLGRSLRSVLNQTYQDFEIIVVDDASTDDSETVILSLDNEKIRYLRHEKNKGATAARNTGIKAAKGSYIAFQDSDDEWLPEKLEKQMKVFESAPPEVGVVYTGYYKISGNNITYAPSSYFTKKEGNLYQQLLKVNHLSTQCILVYKHCLEKVGSFDENLPRHQDWELAIRLAKHFEFKFIDEPLAIVYRDHASISTNQDALVKASEIIFNKHFLEYNNNKKIIANYYYRYGKLFCSSGNIKKGRDYYFKAFKAFPFDCRFILAILISSFGPIMYIKFVTVYRKLRNWVKITLLYN